MFCPQCGTNNHEAVLYCIRCGANLGEIRKSLSGLQPTSPGLRINLSLQQILKTGSLTSLIAFLISIVALLMAISVVGPNRSIIIIIAVVSLILGYLASNAACLITLRRLDPLAKKSLLSPQTRTAREILGEPLAKALSTAPDNSWLTPPPSVIEHTTRNLNDAGPPLARNHVEE